MVVQSLFFFLVFLYSLIIDWIGQMVIISTSYVCGEDSVWPHKIQNTRTVNFAKFTVDFFSTPIQNDD